MVDQYIHHTPAKVNFNCEICGIANPHFEWCDVHGVAICGNCGISYKLYHYGDGNNRIEKDPELLTKKEWVEVVKKYWNETGMKQPKEFLMGRNSSYNTTTKEEYESWDKWLEDNKDILSNI